MDDGQIPDTQEPHQPLTDKSPDMLDREGDIKNKLREIYSEIQTFFATDPDDKLVEEISAHYNNYKTLLEKYAKDLTRDERAIIATGEVSAGKSSVLNLLLGFDVLPTATLPSTGAVCRLYNNQTKKAEVLDMECKVIFSVQVENNDEKKFKKELKDYISPKKKREEHQVKYVDIYWPIPFLRNNVFVVDTPGVGESEEMKKRVLEYLPNAVALIYVIDPTRGGGVSEDRIVPLFDAIRGKENQDGIREIFDPSCAMFVCNKWDIIEDEEDDTEDVKGYIQETLKNKWPNLEERQIHRISSKKAKKKMEKNKPVPLEFQNFKNGVEELIEVSLSAKARQHEKWLEKFLVTVQTNLKSHIETSNLSKDQKEKQLKTGKELVSKLEGCCESSKARLQNEAKDYCAELAKKLYNHIHDEKNRKIMFPWDKVPLPDKGGDRGEIRREAEKLIHSLVMDELNRCLRIYGGIQIQEKLLKAVQKEANSIRNVRLALEKLFHSPEEVNNQETESLVENFQSEDDDEDEWNKGTVAVVALTSPLWFPLALAGGLIGIPLVLAGTTIKDKMKMAKYKTNKQHYMEKWSMKYVRNFTEPMVHEWLDKTFFGSFFESLRDLFDKELPQTVAGSKKLFDHLNSEVRSDDSIRQLYAPKLKECNRILQKLRDIIQAEH